MLRDIEPFDLGSRMHPQGGQRRNASRMTEVTTAQ